MSASDHFGKQLKFDLAIVLKTFVCGSQLSRIFPVELEVVNGLKQFVNGRSFLKTILGSISWQPVETMTPVGDLSEIVTAIHEVYFKNDLHSDVPF